jgi:hypothetical protein
MINRKYIDARKRVWAHQRAEQARQVRSTRAARKAGVLGLTAAQVIMREQLAARVAEETAARMRVLTSDDPPPAPEPAPGPFTKQFNTLTMKEKSK